MSGASCLRYFLNMVSQATARAPATESPPPTKQYFAYGSNLHLRQMKRRCPDSKFIGWARLPNHRWHINERGYANVVEAEGHWVDGLVYEIGEQDEARLDINEGVSKNAYAKQYMTVILHRAQAPLYRRPTAWIVDQGGPAKVRELASAKGANLDQMEKQYERNVLVYISLNYITDSEPKKEYINRINLGVADARALGVGDDYISNCIRPFVPPNQKKPVSKAKTPANKAASKTAAGGGAGGSAGGSGAGGGRASGASTSASASAKRDASPLPAKKKQTAAQGTKRSATAQRSTTPSPPRKAPASSRKANPSPQRSTVGNAQKNSAPSLPRPSSNNLQPPAAGNPQRSSAGNLQRPPAGNPQRPQRNLLAVPSDRRRARSDVGPTPPPLPPRPPRRMQSIPVIILDDRHINITRLR